ncbi:MAG: response regulator [Aggregatilineales bacterium]
MTIQQHILVIEDNPHIQDVFSRVLIKFGYRVTVIGDGAEALDYLKGCVTFPDLIVLDVNLPNVSGLYILKYLRTKLHQMDVKVVLATANQITSNTPEAKLADKFVLKPIPPKQLVELMAEMLPDHFVA